MSTMAKIQDIAWSPRTYELKEVIRECRFPVLVKVTTGFYASNEIDSIANEQILRIHRLQRQQRVIAMDKRGRYFSIPVQYRFSKFDLLRNGYPEGASRHLWEIVEGNALPLDVRFASQNELVFGLKYIDDSVRLGDNFGKLTLIKMYEEHYLQSNAINDGTLDKTVINIPMYSKLCVVTGQGLRSGNRDKWKKMCAIFDNAVKKKVNFDKSPGNLDISLFSQGNLNTLEQNFYEELEPYGTLTITPRSGGSRTSRDAQTNPPKLPERPASIKRSPDGFRATAPSPVYVPSLSPSRVEEMKVGRYNLYNSSPFRRHDGRPSTFSAATAASSGLTPGKFKAVKIDGNLERKHKQRRTRTDDENRNIRPVQSLRVRKKVSFFLDDIPQIESNEYETLRQSFPVDIPPPDYDMNSMERQPAPDYDMDAIDGRKINSTTSGQVEKQDSEGAGYLVPPPPVNSERHPSPSRNSSAKDSKDTVEQGPSMSQLLAELTVAQKRLKKVNPESPQNGQQNASEQGS
ncbi:uncharacterized protein [Ptychodera flava]|uniref:uncharacterized protein isoform X1 n=1 Tax=Ptychodera flava TaxID=63121 RepID=UPI00396A9BEB